MSKQGKQQTFVAKGHFVQRSNDQQYWVSVTDSKGRTSPPTLITLTREQLKTGVPVTIGKNK